MIRFLVVQIFKVLFLTAYFFFNSKLFQIYYWQRVYLHECNISNIIFWRTCIIKSNLNDMHNYCSCPINRNWHIPLHYWLVCTLKMCKCSRDAGNEVFHTGTVIINTQLISWAQHKLKDQAHVPVCHHVKCLTLLIFWRAGSKRSIFGLMTIKFV